MNLPFEFQVALRYLLAKRKQAFISIVSFISMLGVGVGVMAVIIALAMMTGLQLEIRDRIIGSNPHIYVWNTAGITDPQAEAARLGQFPHVIGAAPAILGQGLISAAHSSEPVQIKGIDPALEQHVTDIRQAMRSGSVEGLNGTDPDEAAGILLGKDLAAKLGVSVGDQVYVLTPQGSLSPMGRLPRTRRLRVAGIFTLGLVELDSSLGYVSLDVAKTLFDKTHVDLIQLRVDDMWAASTVAKAIMAKLGTKYLTEDWQAMNSTLFSALWLEKIAVSLAIGLIVMVAALNIVASLILLVMDKTRDIAILKTMGASAASVTAWDPLESTCRHASLSIL